ncbi:MAG: hypothetical protein KF857_12275 [Fimbriimonadaceae bacterium]|nr:hypothetical protein [Fimbriimonadaceae bacterium]
MVWLALAAALAPADFDVAFRSGSGTTLTVGGLPLVQSSGFQYYAPGWSKGYFSSTWRDAKVSRGPDGTVTLTWDSPRDNVSARGVMTPTADGCTVAYTFEWSGDDPALVEVQAGRLWSRVFASGQVAEGDMTVTRFPLPSGEPLPIGGSAKTWRFTAAPADLTVASSADMVLLDGRGTSRAWADGGDAWWLGSTAVPVAKGKPAHVRITYAVARHPAAFQPAEAKTLATKTGENLVELDPSAEPLPLVPRPQSIDPGVGFVDCSADWRVEGSNIAKVSFEDAVGAWARLWDWQRQGSGPVRRVAASAVELGLPPEGYIIDILDADPAVRVRARDELGLRHAFQTLGMLARPVNGRLRLPVCTIKDWPALPWRGVHMFVGPLALPYQSTLVRDVLGPLKFNHVVLQCERTDWKATPGVATDETMKKADLVALFDRYRRAGIEPVPLIQSLGHCEWLFANGQNLDIAQDRDHPYAVDPFTPRTRRLFTDLWTEVVQALRPRVVHFGLDETDMEGVSATPAEVTRQWKEQVPFLMGLARQLGVTPMLWGDMALAQGEAPDATNAPDPASAAVRRSVVSPGTLVADWHYVNNPDPKAYTSLALWKQCGARPIASSWFEPGNIRGQALAAKALGGSGLLQTTWAGYTSSPESTVREFRQFSAYVLAADYAWSGREELPDKLAYDPAAVLRRLAYEAPRPLRAMSARALTPEGVTTTSPLAVGPYHLAVFSGQGVHSPVDFITSKEPGSRTWVVGKPARAVLVGIDCTARVKPGTVAGRLEVHTRSGKTVVRDLVYGQDVRAVGDGDPTFLPSTGGVSAAWIDLGPDAWVSDIALSAKDPVAGLRLRALAVVP